MAELKRKTISFESKKQIKLYGNSISIGRTGEIGEGYAPNILSRKTDEVSGKEVATVSNPYHLSKDDVMELADYMIRLWMDVRDNVRKYGIDDPKIFSKD